MQLDFLPESVKRKREKVRLRIIFAYVLVIVFALFVGIWYYNELKFRHTGHELGQVNSRLKSMDEQLARLKELEIQLGSLQLMQRIDTSLGTSVNTVDILQELGTILPSNMSLTNLMIETKPIDVKFNHAKSQGSALRAVSSDDKRQINRVRLVITGISNDNVTVANFIAALSSSRIFEEVNMGYSKIIEFRGREAKEFQANCYVVR